MPTHQDLLSAEVAFILYDGQVYMSHPTDNDVSLVKLVTQIGNLGHLDKPLIESIHEYLRGGDPPTDLQLVGRYNLTNGRMAPYGPVNSAENQETVRQSIQQAAYNSPESPQEPVSDDPYRQVSTSVTEWKFARQFMPLVDKVGQDDCPFCGQKRSLYHMKDGYLAQAMGVHGHGLCRDCLTTRMDQHEYTTGQKIASMKRLGRFRLVAADVHELAAKMLARLYKEQQFIDPYHSPYETEQKTRDAKQFVELMDYLLKEAPETYKLWPFVFRSYKKDQYPGSDVQQFGPRILLPDKAHVRDILQQATAHSERMKDDPRPEVRVPNFMADFKPTGLTGYSWDQLQNWVYEMNAANGSDDADNQNKVVFEWPDGWTIQELHSDALAKEGELMGHCVGGMGYCQQVNRGQTHIYSLRDPKNGPHVTFEIEGQYQYERDNPGEQFTQNNRPPLSPPPEEGSGKVPFVADRLNDDIWPTWKIIQIQGKQDEEPIPEYRQRINEFISYYRDQGVEMQWHPEKALRPGGEGNNEDYISDVSELMDYWEDYEQGHFNSHDYPSVEKSQRKNSPYDEYGLPHNDWESGLYVPYHRGNNDGGFIDIINQAIQGYSESDGWRNPGLDIDPDELAKALVFLQKEVAVQDPSRAHELTDAIREGEEKLWSLKDEVRENNHEFEWENQNAAWQEIVNDPANEGLYEDDPDIDYEHPDMQEAQKWIDQEMMQGFQQADRFMNSLRSHWAGVGTQAIPQAPPDVQKQINADPDIGGGVPGALSSWQFVRAK